MKYPKNVNAFCPTCKQHTKQTTKQVRQKGRGKAHPNSQANRRKDRWKRGYGGHGKYSKPAVSKKPTPKIDLRFTCMVCKKQSVRGIGFRVKKFELV